jgi:hypothetical protein
MALVAVVVVAGMVTGYKNTIDGTYKQEQR